MSVFCLPARRAREPDPLSGLEDLYEKSDVMIPMRDGVELYTELYIDHERYAEAESEARRALRTHPESWRLWYRLAKAHAKARDPDKALEALFKALELCPESNGSLLNLYAATVDRLGDHDRARVILTDLIAKSPRNPTYHFNLAYSLDLECRVLEAATSYRRTLELERENLQATMALAHIHSGAKRTTCELCKIGFEKNPELFDEDEAQRLVMDAIQFDRCQASWVADLWVDIAKRIGREREIEAALRAIIDGSEVDERVVRVERALRRF